MTKFIVGAALLSLCSIVGAQSTGPFVGSWKVTWQGEKRPQEAQLVIAETGGSWKTASSSRFNNCIGREVPIEFLEVNGNEAEVKLKFSELSGCADATITIKKMDDKTMTGFRGKAELSIVRD